MHRYTSRVALLGALAALVGYGPTAARPVAAQELADVLARHYEAIGGEDAWRSMQTARRSGTLSLMGGAVAGEITAISARPQKFRTEITVQGTQILQGYDGESGWQYNPLAGMTAPQAADASISAMMSEQADLDGALVGWRDEGYSIVVGETETVGGSEMIILEVTFPTGNVSHYYLDAQSYLLAQVVETRPLTGEMTRTVSDYRDVGGGIMVPFRIHSTSAQGDQEVIWDSYEIDIEVDDSIFSMPEGP